MTSFLLQRVTQDELWDLTHDPDKKGVATPKYPAYYCVFGGGLVKFWPPLTNEIILKADIMKVSSFE